VPEPTLGPAIDPRIRAILSDDGPTYDEIKREQRAETELWGGIVEGSKWTGKVYAWHKLKDHAIDHVAELAKEAYGAVKAIDTAAMIGKAFVTLQLACEVTDKAYELAVVIPTERGKTNAEGIERDQKNLAVLMIAQMTQPDLLPDGYFLSECSRVLGTDGKASFHNFASEKASEILGKAKTDPEVARSRDILVASMREGIAMAYQRGIDSKDAFDKLEATDPTFRKRYESDPAFRMGVKSVVWQALNHRDEYDHALPLSAGYRGSMTRM
jgi:hypothetical protein